MKWIRNILLPVVPIYYVVTWLRNWLYDVGIKSSKTYNFPVICVGNLSTGGTGKTPMIEYLIRLLKDEKRVATLSRGYKRSTRGFVLANENADADLIGDEPFQFYSKFGDIEVAVDANRQNGIAQLQSLNPKPDVILLDDAFQHRKVNADLNILLTSYDNLFYKDIVLPTGNLREPRSGYKRAHLIVITKCPNNLTSGQKDQIQKRIKPQKHQEVFFSSIAYSETIISETEDMPLKKLSKFTLVTGIADAKPLVKYLMGLGLDFEHLEYNDHHNFTKQELLSLSKKDLVLTTEKDYVKLKTNEDLKDKLYYLPIETTIENSVAFDNIVKQCL